MKDTIGLERHKISETMNSFKEAIAFARYLHFAVHKLLGCLEADETHCSRKHRAECVTRMLAGMFIEMLGVRETNQGRDEPLPARERRTIFCSMVEGEGPGADQETRADRIIRYVLRVVCVYNMYIPGCTNWQKQMFKLVYIYDGYNATNMIAYVCRFLLTYVSMSTDEFDTKLFTDGLKAYPKAAAYLKALYAVVFHKYEMVNPIKKNQSQTIEKANDTLKVHAGRAHRGNWRAMEREAMWIDFYLQYEHCMWHALMYATMYITHVVMDEDGVIPEPPHWTYHPLPPMTAEQEALYRQYLQHYEEERKDAEFRQQLQKLSDDAAKMFGASVRNVFGSSVSASSDFDTDAWPSVWTAASVDMADVGGNDVRDLNEVIDTSMQSGFESELQADDPDDVSVDAHEQAQQGVYQPCVSVGGVTDVGHGAHGTSSVGSFVVDDGNGTVVGCDIDWGSVVLPTD